MGCFAPIIPGMKDTAAAVPALGTFSCYPTPSSIAQRAASPTVVYGTKTISASASFIATAKPATNTYVNYGCYWDQTLLTVVPDNADSGLASSTISVDTCVAACDNKGKRFAILYGDPVKCYCGNLIGLSLTLTDMERCNAPCPGSAQQNCGSGSGPLVYARADTPLNPWAALWSATRSNTITYACTGSKSRAPPNFDLLITGHR